MLQPQADENNCHNHQHQQVVPQPQRRDFKAKPVINAAKLEAEQIQRIDPGNAFCAVGDVDRTVEVAHQDADNFAEPEGDDGQIVAAQLQRRRAQHDTAACRHQRGERNNHQPGGVQAVRKPTI